MADALGVLSSRIPWSKKPPARTSIDWGNPLSRGLLWAGPGSDGNEVITGTKPVLTVAPTVHLDTHHHPRIGSSRGLQNDTVGASNKAMYYGDGLKRLQRLNGTRVFSVLTFGQFTASVAWQSFFLITRDPRGGPFHKLSIARNSSTTEAYVMFASEGDSWRTTDSSGTGYLPSDGSPFSLGMTCDGSALRFFNEDGFFSEDSSLTADTIGIEDDDPVMLFNEDVSTNGSGRTAGNWDFSLVYDRALSDAETLSLLANPWQVFAPQRVLLPTGIVAQIFGVVPRRF